VSRRTSASFSARSSCRFETIAARSRSVLGTVVTGIASTTVISSAGSEDLRALTPGRPRKVVDRVTSISALVRGCRPQSAPGRPMAEHRSRARGQDRRHPPPPDAERSVTDRVDAAVQRVQGPPREPDVDHPPPRPRLYELGPAHNSMLPPPKPRQEPIQTALNAMRTAFATYEVVNAVRISWLAGTSVVHADDPGRRERASGALDVNPSQRACKKTGSSPAVPPLALIP
jgi:hypothetical protein